MLWQAIPVINNGVMGLNNTFPTTPELATFMNNIEFSNNSLFN